MSLRRLNDAAGVANIIVVNMGTMVVRQVSGETIRMGPPEWTGDYEGVARPLGVVALPQAGAMQGAAAGTRQLSEVLHGCGFATLVFDMQLPGDGSDLDRLSRRIVDVLGWLREHRAGMEVGVFGTRLVASAALQAVAQRPGIATALVMRSASPALVSANLADVQAATLLIVGDDDAQLLQSNRAALRVLTCTKRLEVVPGAGQSADERGVRETVAHLAGAWFKRHLTTGRLQ